MNTPIARICYNGDLFEISMDGSDYYIITNEVYNKIDPTETIGATIYGIFECDTKIDKLYFRLDTGKSVQAVKQEEKEFMSWTWVELPMPFELSLL
jgi:hypothetical protein